MKKNRNKTFALFLTLVLVMMGGMAFGQRPDNGSSNNNNVSTQHVTVGGNVFGGGNKAPVAGSCTVTVNQHGAQIHDVYGGGALADVNVTMVIDESGPEPDTSYVHTSGAITKVDILDGVINGNIYGGGLGDSIVENHVLYDGDQNVAALVYGQVYVNVGDTTTTLKGEATINGSVFGCNNINGTPLDSVFVNIFKTAHTEGEHSNAYPGTTLNPTVINTMALLEASFPEDPDNPTAPATVNYAKRFAIEAVYGGGNKASYKPTMNEGSGSNPSTPKCTTVFVYDCDENTIQTLYGGGNAADVGTSTKHADTRLIVQGGRFDRVFGGGNGYSSTGNHNNPSAANYNPGANIYGTASTGVYGGLYRQVFGGSNQRGDIGTVALTIDKNCDDLLIYESFGGANEADITGSIQTTLLCSNTDYEIHTFYGGSNKADIGGNVTLNVRGGKYTDVFGGSKGAERPDANPTQEQIDAASADIDGNVTLNLHGGTMVNAFGGSDVNGSIGGYITVNVWDTVNHCGLQVDTIYGGGRNARYVPDLIAGKKIISPVVNLWNGTVGHTETEDEVTTTIPGCVFGGGKGGGAYIAAHPKVMIGDTISGHDSNNRIRVLNGNVFGGGNAAVVDGIDSVLMLKANSEVVNLFGGGNAALADTSVVIMNVAATVDTIFGGGNLEGLNGTALVDVSAGTVSGGIYGGSNKSGTIADDIVVNVTGGTIGAAGVRANIHGGGLGNATKTKGNVTVNFGEPSDSHTQYPKLYGDLYGGSGYGDVNDGTDDITVVNILNGEITGDVYGGGLGSTSPDYNAKVNGKVFVNIGKDDNGTYLGKAVFNTYQVSEETHGGKVFGCNNANGSPQDSVFVNIFRTHHDQHNAYPSEPSGGWTIANLAINSATQTYAIQAVYGGGNEAAFTPSLTDDDKPKSTTVHIFDCDKNTVKEVYGGGNAANVGIDDDESTPDDETQPANTFVIIDGGRINRVFGGGKGVAGSGGVAANIYGTATTTISAGLIDTIFGGSNMNGNIDSISLILAHNPTSCAEIFNQVYGGANVAVLTGDLSTTIECGVDKIGDIYGGSNLANINGSVELNIRGGDFNTVFGGSKGASGSGNGANISGDVTLNLEGGTMVNAFGGSNVQGNIGGYITVNVLDTVTGCGLQVDTIYGAGQDAAYMPNPIAGKKIVSPVVNLLKGKVGEENASHVVTVPGCVFGGGKGSTAIVTAHPKVIIGDTISAHSSYVATVLGNVFGGGNAAYVDGIDSVLMLKSNNVVSNLFGGGNAAYADSAVVIMTAGAVDTIFGGGNLAGLGNETSHDEGYALVNVSNGTVYGGIYGGSNKEGTVYGNVTVNVTGGTIGTDATHTANIHGGGYGNSTSTNGHVVVNIGAAPVAPSTTPTGNAVIWGDVYGGSADGSVNNDTEDHTWVTLYGGTINGSLYGGGLGIDNADCNVNGAVKVTVEGGHVNTTTNALLTTGSVFGCNNAKGSPKSIVEVEINSTAPSTGSGNSKVYALQGVYGGGNLAAYVPTTTSADYPKVTVNGCASSIKDVYGGGNAAPVPNANVIINGGDISRVFAGGNGESGTPAHIGWNNTAATPTTDDYGTGDASAEINGGTILQVFGGSNANGVIRGSSTLDIDKSGACDMKIGEVYGGGNLAAGNAGTITIGCTGTWTTGEGNTHEHHNNSTNRIGYELEGIGTVYGGANQANVNNGIDLTIESGIVENVFGGNNTSGSVNDTIRVTINKDSDCAWYVGNVYGGGNLARYSAPSNKPNYPKVRVLNGTVSEDVFGGGLGNTGDNGKVTGNPQVIVNGSGAAVNGGVYGGGSLAPTQGNPLVTQTLGATAKVFGGGKAASVTGAPTVAINGGTVSTGVYGGCDSQGNVSGNIIVNVTGGTIGSQANLNQTTPVTADVYGGGFGQSTSTSGNVEVNIGALADTHSEFPKIYGDVYGGSALGNVNDAASDKTTVNILNGTLLSKEIPHTTPVNYIEYIGGNVFGGGLGRKDDPSTGDANEAIEAKVNGVVTVNIGAPSTNGRDLNPDDDVNRGMATIQGNVYGCNNTNGSPQDSVTVHVYRTYRSDSAQIYVPSGMDTVYAIANVFGGGNKANYVPLSTATHKKLKVMIHGCYNSVRRVFGGSNAAASGNSSISTKVCTNIDGGRFYQVFGGGNGEVSAANIYGDLDLQIHGGIVGQFYGASNQNGTITGNINTLVDNTSGCQSIQITEYFCDGNYSNVYGDLVSTITCSDGLNVTSLYGGCNQANIYGDVVLNLCGGTYTNVFGGSKGVAGGISADILAVTQAVHDAHPEVPLTVGHGGNITLNLYGGTIKNVYGGSNINGKIQGTITVNVMDDGEDCPLYITNLYGGSNMTNYEPDSVIVNGNKVSIVSPIVNVMNIYSNITGNVYGGSKGVQGTEVTVKANPRVNIGYESTMSGYVPSGYTVPTSPKTTIQGSIFGGGDAAKVEGNTEIYLNKHAKVIGNVYGGGNMGEVDGDTKVIINGKRQ